MQSRRRLTGETTRSPDAEIDNSFTKRRTCMNKQSGLNSIGLAIAKIRHPRELWLLVAKSASKQRHGNKKQMLQTTRYRHNDRSAEGAHDNKNKLTLNYNSLDTKSQKHVRTKSSWTIIQWFRARQDSTENIQVKKKKKFVDQVLLQDTNSRPIMQAPRQFRTIINPLRTIALNRTILLSIKNHSGADAPLSIATTWSHSKEKETKKNKTKQTTK